MQIEAQRFALFFHNIQIVMRVTSPGKARSQKHVQMHRILRHFSIFFGHRETNLTDRPDNKALQQNKCKRLV